MLQQIRSRKEAEEIIGRLSSPGKLPFFSYNLPIQRCVTGSKLMKVKGSTCSICYGAKGWYPRRKVIQEALERRYQSLFDDRWVEAIVFLIRYHKCAYFRWHDIGDLQGSWHLAKIIAVAKLCSDTQFWLPTREWGMVRHVLEDLQVERPKNLKIRLSAFFYDKSPPNKLAKRLGVLVSAVSSDKKEVNCPSHEKTYITANGQKKEWKGFCGSCRACFDDDVFQITYLKH